MFALIASSFLFGLANPLGALLVGEEDSILFTYHFLVAMAVIQFPLILPRLSQLKELKGLTSLAILIVVAGIISIFLYWCEFTSYQVGLPVAHVTFLMLTVPAWVMLYEYFRGRGHKGHLKKWAFALLGSALLIQPYFGSAFSFSLLLPSIYSILMATLLVLSKKTQEMRVSPILCSFFIDFVALIGLTGYLLIDGFGPSLVEIPQYSGNILLYAGVIGVMPGILLLYGLRSASLITASAIVMLDPLVSGTLSLLIHNEALGANFLIGSLFVCLSGVPENASLLWERAKLVWVSIVIR